MSDPIAAAEAAGKARDIANRFETAAARLKDIAEPVGALDSLQLTHLKASIEEPRQADWDKDPVSARARQDAWGRANRARLARCTGRDRAVFQLIGNQDDARLLDMARAEISRFLGGEGPSTASRSRSITSRQTTS